MQESKPLHKVTGQVVEMTPFLPQKEGSKYGQGTITIAPKGYDYENKGECVKFSVKDELLMNQIESSVMIEDEIEITFLLDGRNYEDRQTGKPKNMTTLSVMAFNVIASGDAIRKKKELMSKASALTAEELEALLAARSGVLTAAPKATPAPKAAPQKPAAEPTASEAEAGGEEGDEDLPF